MGARGRQGAPGGEGRGGRAIRQDLAALHLNLTIAKLPPASEAGIEVAPKSSRTAEDPGFCT